MNPAVLIVGAGPSGLTLAMELARRDISFRIIDKAASISPLSKAIGLQARTLEIFRDIGIADKIVDLKNALTGIRLYIGEKNHVSMDFSEIHSQFNYIAMLEQPKTEQVMVEHLASLGKHVERGVTLLDFQQDADGVNAKLAHADGREENIRTHWLVGADGAHSVVRKKAGLSFSGFPFNEQWMLADVHIDWDQSRQHFSLFLCDQGFVGVFPLPNNIWRLIIEISDRQEGALTFAEVKNIFSEKVAVKARLYDPVWLANFRINQRRVNQYQKDRVFVAGDASHIHSPVGAQGMNTGIQDAHNLAWKLALVEKGLAKESLLNTYGLEREKVAAGLLRATTFFTKMAIAKNPIYRFIRNHLLPFFIGFKTIQKKMQGRLSQLDIRYPSSDIVARAEGGRAPLSEALWSQLDGRFYTLLLFADEAEALAISHIIQAQYPDVIKTHRVVDQAIWQLYNIKTPALVLIRPDLYIAYQGSLDQAALSRFLQHSLLAKGK